MGDDVLNSETLLAVARRADEKAKLVNTNVGLRRPRKRCFLGLVDVLDFVGCELNTSPADSLVRGFGHRPPQAKTISGAKIVPEEGKLIGSQCPES